MNSIETTLGRDFEPASDKCVSSADYLPIKPYYARPLGEQFGRAIIDDVEDIDARPDLSDSVKNLLAVQMQSSAAQFNYEQFLLAAQMDTFVNDNDDQYVIRGLTVAELYQRCKDGTASPIERLIAMQHFPVTSIEVARQSYYWNSEHGGESEMKAAVENAIVDVGGSVYNQPDLFSSKIKALDAHPIYDTDSVHVEFVSLNTKASAEYTNSQGVEANLIAHNSVHPPVEVEGVDYLEAMVVSIKHDIGEVALSPSLDSNTIDNREFIIRHRQKVLIEYNRLTEVTRNALLSELKNIPVEALLQRMARNQDADIEEDNLSIGYLNDHELLQELIRNIIETGADDVELITSIYYAVERPREGKE